MPIIFFIFFILSVFSSHSCIAQRGPGLGIKAGKVVDKIGDYLPDAFIVEEQNYSANFSNGIHYGLVFRYGFTNSIGFSTGLSVIHREVRSIVRAPESTLSIGKDLTNFELPVSLSYRKVLDGAGKTAFTGYTGAAFVFWLPVNYKIGVHSNDFEATNTELHSTFRQKKLSLGLKTGLGIEHSVNRYGAIYIGLSYNKIFSGFLYHYGEYTTGIVKHQTDAYLNGSYLMFDVVYYLPWNLLFDKKIKESGPNI